MICSVRVIKESCVRKGKEEEEKRSSSWAIKSTLAFAQLIEHALLRIRTNAGNLPLIHRGRRRKSHKEEREKNRKRQLETAS